MFLLDEEASNWGFSLLRGAALQRLCAAVQFGTGDWTIELTFVGAFGPSRGVVVRCMAEADVSY